MAAVTSDNIWLWFGGLFSTIGAAFLAVGALVGADMLFGARALEHDGAAATGIVMKKEIGDSQQKSRHGGRPTYWVSYRFVAASGETIDADAEVDARAWKALAERGPVSVTYARASPGRHRIEGEVASWVGPAIFLVLGAMFAPVGGYVLWLDLRRRRGRR